MVFKIFIYCTIKDEHSYTAQGWQMESSTPQEGGTTDEEYYVQLQQMLEKATMLATPYKNILVAFLQINDTLLCKSNL